LLLATFGGGLTWAAAVVRWADVEAIAARREVRCAAAHPGSADRPFGRAPAALAG